MRKVIETLLGAASGGQEGGVQTLELTEHEPTEVDQHVAKSAEEVRKAQGVAA